jgi:hypothetical protein
MEGWSIHPQTKVVGTIAMGLPGEQPAQPSQRTFPLTVFEEGIFLVLLIRGFDPKGKQEQYATLLSIKPGQGFAWQSPRQQVRFQGEGAERIPTSGYSLDAIKNALHDLGLDVKLQRLFNRDLAQ